MKDRMRRKMTNLCRHEEDTIDEQLEGPTRESQVRLKDI